MKLTEKFYLLFFSTLIVLTAWYFTKKIGAETMLKIGAGSFGLGAVMQVIQTLNTNSNPTPKRRRKKA
jgi:hypothetical protein